MQVTTTADYNEATIQGAKGERHKEREREKERNTEIEGGST